MKVFFDTNVYIAEALLGQVAEQLLEATERASWRICSSLYLLDELERLLSEKLGFSRRLAYLSRRRIIRRAKLIEPGASHNAAPRDSADSPSYAPPSPPVPTTSSRMMPICSHSILTKVFGSFRWKTISG
jgi:hypothetical protein